VSQIKRKKNESFEAFLRRVKRRWQQSGKILQVKKIQFFTNTPSKSNKRRSALHRLDVTEKINYLKKIGKLPEEKKKYRR